MKKNTIIRLALVVMVFVLTYKFGVEPMMFGDAKIEQGGKGWAKGSIKSTRGVYDVVVVGAEPEGVAAVLSAARAGAKAVLITDKADMESVVNRCLLFDEGPSVGQKGEALERGIYKEIFGVSGTALAPDYYKTRIEGLLKKEKNLKIIHSAVIKAVDVRDGILQSIWLKLKEGEIQIRGKRFIDATEEGTLLELCNVPKFTGSGDLNLPGSFYPAGINFEIQGVNWEDIEYIADDVSQIGLIQKLKMYKPIHEELFVGGLKVKRQSDSSVVVKALMVAGINMTDANAVKTAYSHAAEEAANFAEFLAGNIDGFKGAKFKRAADSLYIRETIHYQGIHTLEVREIMENMDFADKIAVAAHPISGSKFAWGLGEYIIGKPAQYSVPLGCIIPLKVDNVLMVGRKASFSSLASSSAGALSTSVEIGEAAGTAAVFSIVKGITPRELETHKDTNTLKQLGNILRKQGIYLGDDFKAEADTNASWVYPAVNELRNLGLIAGGVENNYRLKNKATQSDLTSLLLNGTFRKSNKPYPIEMDAKLSPYCKKSILTPEKAAEILLLFHGKEPLKGKAYKEACKLGYINDVMQLRLKDRKELMLEDVYYLSWDVLR